MENNNWFHVIKDFFLLLLIIGYFNCFPVLTDQFSENVYLLVFVDILALGSLVLITSKLTQFTGNLRSKKIFKSVVIMIFAFILLNSLFLVYMYASFLVENITVLDASYLISYISILVFSGAVIYKV